MKVVQMLPDLNGGGVERGTLEVAQALVSAGHESVVISAGGSMVEQLEAEGSRHVKWDLGRKSLLTFRHIWALRRWLKKEQPDVLHLRSRLPAWVAYLAWRGLPKDQRPRLVTTVHGLYSVSRYSAIMCKGERVIAVSETVRDYIRRNYPEVDMHKVERVYRGIDPADFPYGHQPSADWLKKWHDEYPELEGKLVLTLPGRLTRLKGHHDFLNLVHALKNIGLPVHGLIVGGEDPKRLAYAEELRSRVSELNLDDAVTFTGARRDIRDIYAISSLVLSLSTKPESFGRTVLEALSMGVPVVGYDHGGVGEILGQLYPQGLTPLSDPQALAARVRDVLAVGGKPTENHKFLKSHMLEQTLAVYEALTS